MWEEIVHPPITRIPPTSSPKPPLKPPTPPLPYYLLNHKSDFNQIFRVSQKNISLLFWAYPKNLVKIGLLVEAVDTFCGMEQGQGQGRDGQTL